MEFIFAPAVKPHPQSDAAGWLTVRCPSRPVELAKTAGIGSDRSPGWTDGQTTSSSPRTDRSLRVSKQPRDDGCTVELATGPAPTACPGCRTYRACRFFSMAAMNVAGFATILLRSVASIFSTPSL